MKLEKISLHKLGPFEDLEIAVQPCNDPKRADVHVFVGENGTGKSTILRAIAGCLGVDRGRLQNSAAADDAFTTIETASDAIVLYPVSHQFRQARTRRLAGDENAEAELRQLAEKLSKWTETRTIVAQELRQIERVLKTAVA